MPPEPEYEIGYKKPPKHTQFQKGQSGNPWGRPRRQKNARTVLNDALNEKVTIIENGRRRHVTKCEAALKQFVNSAAQGNPKSLQMLLRLLRLLDNRDIPDQLPKASPRSAVVILPHNNRDPLDPELVDAYARVKAEFEANRACERKPLRALCVASARVPGAWYSLSTALVLSLSARAACTRDADCPVP